MINIGVIFGGKTVEHEVSVITAMQTIAVIKDIPGYNVVPIYISKEGLWYSGEGMDDIDAYKNIPSLLKNRAALSLIKGSRPHTARLITNDYPLNILDQVDMVFPLVHGTGGEDGHLQGLIEGLEIPYMGSSVMGSAIAMDKIATKNILKSTDIQMVQDIWFYSGTCTYEMEMVLDTSEEILGYPVIVKPSDIGSSVGIRICHDRQQLRAAAEFAAQFSGRVLIEQMLQEIYEVNISVMGDAEDHKLSVCERPFSSSDFLTYEDKYMQGEGSHKGMASTKRQIPAEISPQLRQKIEEDASTAFSMLGLSGVVRIDFLVQDEIPYLCEVNTIPGSLAYYLWEASGVSFDQQIREMIHFANKKWRRQMSLNKSNDINLLAEGNLLGIKK